MMNTGEHRGLTTDTTRSTNVVPSYCRVALSRPIRRDAPPASTTAASGTGVVTAERLVDGPGVFAPQQGLQCRRVVRLRVPGRGHLLACRIVVCRLADLSEHAHQHFI